jgi:hypothetical protein
MHINELNSIEDKTTFLKKDQNNREINFYKINNVKVTGDNLFYPNVLLFSNNKIYQPISEKIMSLKNLDVIKHYDYVEQQKINTIDYPVFYFIYNTDNYYHFIYDTLPYLISFIELKKSIPNIKLLMNYSNPSMNSSYRFVTEFLEILNIYDDDITIVSENTEYKDMYISSSYTHDNDSNLPPRSEIYELYQSIVKTIKNKYNIETPKKIYISRRSWLHNDFSNIGTNYTTRRRLVNEDHLVNLLVDNDYQEIFTEKLSTIEKIIIFSNADIIVGAIGGGIANVIFSRAETKLITLVSPTFLDVNNRFRYCLDQVNCIYITNTKHTEVDYWKKYMRVKSNDIIGEIEEVNSDTILVSYTKEKLAGWNSNIIYDKILLKKSDCTPLDNGLNSSWEIDIEDIKKYIN